MTRRLPRIRRRPVHVAVVGALLLALVGAAVAQASALTITTHLMPFATSQSRCTSQAVTVTNAVTSSATSSVVVSNVDTAGCAGRALVVTVYDPTATGWQAAGKLVATGTVTTATATLTASTGSFTPAAGLKVHVAIDGWQVPATWSLAPVLPLISCTSPTNLTATCTAVLHGTPDTWGGPPNTDYNVYFDVSSSAATTSVRWQITINLADATLPFVAQSMNANNQSQLASGWTCSQLPTLTLTGQDGPNTSLVGGRKTVRLYLNGHSTAAAGGSLYVCP